MRVAYFSEKFGKAEKASVREWWRVTRVTLAYKFHWTLDYVDRLSQADLADVLSVLKGWERARD